MDPVIFVAATLIHCPVHFRDGCAGNVRQILPGNVKES
jgi:hypothetical protein